MNISGKTIGAIIAFGSKQLLPLRGFPLGKTRVRARNDEFVLVRVRTTDGIREYYVTEVNGFWEPAIEKGFNLSNNQYIKLLDSKKIHEQQI